MAKKTLLAIILVIALSVVTCAFVACNSIDDDSSTGSADSSTVCEHVYGEWETVTVATCQTEGEEKATCTKCGDEKTRVIAKVAHDYTDSVKTIVLSADGESATQNVTCKNCSNEQATPYSGDYVSKDIAYRFVSGKRQAVSADFFVFNGNTYYAVNNVIVKNYYIINDTLYDFGNDGIKKDVTLNNEFVTVGGNTYYIINNIIVKNYYIINGTVYDFGNDGIKKNYKISGLLEIGDKTYYVEDDNKVAVGNRVIGDTIYRFGEDGAKEDVTLNNEFVTVGGNTYYVINNIIVKNYYIIDDVAYDFGDDGIKKDVTIDKTFIEVNGNTYYIINNIIVKNYYIINGTVYDFGDNGVKKDDKISGLLEIGDKTYYVEDDNKIAVGNRVIGDTMYRFGEDGAKEDVTLNNEFVIVGGNTYYVINNIIVKNYYIIDDVAYDFGNDGIKKDLTIDKTFIEVNGNTYYIINNIIVKNYYIINGTVYDFGNDGIKKNDKISGLLEIGDKTYYVEDDNKVAVGNRVIGDTMYRFGSDGAKEDVTLNNEFVIVGGNTYYVINNIIVKNYYIINGTFYDFGDDGIKKDSQISHDFVEIDGKKYYVWDNNEILVNTYLYSNYRIYRFGEDGAMLTDVTFEGYYFGLDGALTVTEKTYVKIDGTYYEIEGNKSSYHYHENKYTYVPATCTKPGYQEYNCVCGYSCDHIDFPSKGHTPSDWITDTEATCENAGARHKECTVCGETLESEVVPALGHDYVYEITAYNGTQVSKLHGTCIFQGCTSEDELDVIYYNVTVNATCSDYGVASIIKTDNTTLSIKIVKAPHNVNGLPIIDDYRRPYTMADLERYNISYLGSISSISCAPLTEDSSMNAFCKCTDCKQTFGVYLIGDHKKPDDFVEPTPDCENEIVTYYVCANGCGQQIQVIIAPAGHTPSDWITDAEVTCENAGARHKECTVCGKTLESEVVPALGHDYVNGACTRCGAKDSQQANDTFTRVDENGVESATGNYILFGSYPQTKVTDDSVISALNNQTGELPTSDNNQTWTNYEYYISDDNSTAYMWYKDVTYNNAKYRGVYFTSYRPYQCYFKSNGSNSNQPTNSYDTNIVYWFKYESVKWQILEEKDGKAFLLSEIAIDSQQYYHANSTRTVDDNTVYANNYAESDIRAWLNQTFYNTAFSSLQQSIIQTTLVDNSARSTNPTNNATRWNEGANKYACENTEDKIFLLSMQEVTNPAYGFNMELSEDSMRQKQSSDYAKSQGCERSTRNGFLNNCPWWLRSIDWWSSNYVENINYAGAYNANDIVYYTDYGIVPALWLDLNDAYTRVDENGVESATGNYILFGSYPQTKVTDDSVISALNNQMGELPTSDNNQTWTNYEYYISGDNSTAYMWYKDVTYNNAKYRGVYFTSYRPYGCGYSSSASNTLQDDNGYYTSTVYWFKYESVKWRILEEKDGKAFLMSEIAIDSQQYYHTAGGDTRMVNGKTIYENNYAESEIRAWLNQTFYNTAFNNLQQSLIQITVVDNSARSTNPNENESYWNNGVNDYVCENTEDKIFLLSEQEVTNSAYGFNTVPNKEDSARQKQSSDYAKSQGCLQNTNSDYADNCFWFLRSPDRGSTIYARYIYISGNTNYIDTVCTTGYGVVPALWLDLN